MNTGTEQIGSNDPGNYQRQGPPSAGLVASAVLHPDEACSQRPRKFPATRVDFHELVQDASKR
jgi:hypothetical protein